MLQHRRPSWQRGADRTHLYLSSIFYLSRRQIETASSKTTYYLCTEKPCLCGRSRYFSAEAKDTTSTSIDGEQRNELPVDVQLQMDFFGEPVTFSGLSRDDKTTRAMAAFDGFLLAAVSKGRSCIGGGDEFGIETKALHSVAITWAEALRHASVWNNPGTKKSAPMFGVVTVAPALTQGGIAYVRHLDTMLERAERLPGLPPIQMESIAEHAVAKKDVSYINSRERMHLNALEHLLRDDHETALAILVGILRTCPGDTLALSLVMDLAQTQGDKSAALRAAGSVAAYWNERSGGWIRPALPGYSMAEALTALGFAVGSRLEEAEIMADHAMNTGKKVCGGLATWAQTHVFDAGGRISEGISALSNHDGIRNYEGCGLLFFDARLSGYGSRFSLDREERGRGKSAALRLYEANFERVLDYSGFDRGQPFQQPLRKAPLGWVRHKVIDSGDNSSDDSDDSFFSKLFPRKDKGQQHDVEEEVREDYELIEKDSTPPSMERGSWQPVCEDVLTWLPPTPLLISEATLLLLRFTLNGTISAKNPRWDNIRNAWTSILDIERKHGESPPLKFCPLASVSASLLFPPSETGGDRVGGGRLANGLNSLGRLLRLGNVASSSESTEESKSVREVIADREPNFWLPTEDDQSREWRGVVETMWSAIDGLNYPEEEERQDVETIIGSTVDRTLKFEGWDFDTRPILEHAIVYAACKAGDIDSLSRARAICSQGVALRPNSPEEWWRYSIVVGLLGDEVASENALNTSINVGAGQGAR